MSIQKITTIKTAPPECCKPASGSARWAYRLGEMCRSGCQERIERTLDYWSFPLLLGNALIRSHVKWPIYTGNAVRLWWLCVFWLTRHAKIELRVLPQGASASAQPSRRPPVLNHVIPRFPMEKPPARGITQYEDSITSLLSVSQASCGDNRG